MGNKYAKGDLGVALRREKLTSSERNELVRKVQDGVADALECPSKTAALSQITGMTTERLERINGTDHKQQKLPKNDSVLSKLSAAIDILTDSDKLAQWLEQQNAQLEYIPVIAEERRL